MEIKLTCICCPSGCPLTVTVEDGKALSVTGNSCLRGRAYGLQEAESPVRTLTTTVRLEGAERDRLPVRTSRPIPKNLITSVMRYCDSLTAKAPVHIGDVLCADIFSTGADVVATDNAEMTPGR